MKGAHFDCSSSTAFELFLKVLEILVPYPNINLITQKKLCGWNERHLKMGVKVYLNMVTITLFTLWSVGTFQIENVSWSVNCLVIHVKLETGTLLVMNFHNGTENQTLKMGSDTFFRRKMRYHICVWEVLLFSKI